MIIHNALINGEARGWVAVEPPFIMDVGLGDAPAELLGRHDEIVDGRGMLLLPGAIDAHVHFREPGLTHKATIASESRAALLGGVTSYIEMPNTLPTTTTVEAWQQKMEIAGRDSAVNYAFMMGATADNLREILSADSALMPGVKVFMGSSTGNMLLDGDAALRAVFAEQPFRVTVHAEDQATINRMAAKYANRTDIAAHSLIRPAEACMRATERAMELAVRYGTRLHVAHVSTAAETLLFDPSDSPSGKQITAEVSPHHLTFTDEDYAALGARIKMNPAVKTAADRDALRAAAADGRLDIVATDHAPHLLSEKEGPLAKAVSGAPMVQFSLPVMLDLFDVPTVVARMCSGPAALFGIDRRGRIERGFYADLVLMELLDKPHTITDAEVASLCGWTPLDGRQTLHRVARTWVNGADKALPLRFSQA